MNEQDTRLINPTHILRWMETSFVVDVVAGTIVWKSPPKNHPRLAGKPAGSERATHSGKKYVHVKMDGVALKRSWLVFLWFHRRWPRECLDHIDGNSLNDSIDNLREATITQNAWNHRKRARRIALPMGVRSVKSGRYQARIAVNGKMHHLGTYATPEQANAAYTAKRKEFYHEFA